MAWREYDHPDAQALADALAAALGSACEQGIEARGQALLSLAGGRTPWPAYRALAASALDFGKVTAMPGDERCVAHEDPACNLRGLREAFADAQGIQLASLTVADGEPARSEQHAQAMLAEWPGAFDAVLLGMGGDGHFASIFPGAAERAEALDLDSRADALMTVPEPLPPEAPYPRITLTLQRLLRSRRLLLAVTGNDKRTLLRRVQADETSPLPIAHLLHCPQARVEIHWCP